MAPPQPIKTKLDDLLSRLRRAGAGQPANRLEAQLLGIAAAPPPHEPAAVIRDLAPEADPRLVADTEALLDAIRQAYDDEISRNASAERLAALRDDLARRGLHGFVVPTNDEYFGEYVPRRARRLNWLTGFSGSAGLAIVLDREAALFVDGRYTLQAQAQVDEALFSFHHVTDEPPTAWLGEAVAAGRRVGYDPRLLTVEMVERYRTTCERTGAEFVPCDGNPIDSIWHDQPPPPLGRVVPHDETFAGESSASKRTRLGEQMAKDGIDAAVIVNGDSLAWLLNIRGGDVEHTPLALGHAVLYTDGRVDLFIDERKLGREARDHLGNGIAVHPPEALEPALSALGADELTVLLAKKSTGAWFFDLLETAGADIRAGDDPCSLPKAIKNETEQAGARAGHLRDGAALVRFLAWFAAHSTSGELDELSAAAKLREFRSGNEMFRDLSFDTISGFGANGAIVHYRVTPETSRRIEPGSLFLLDSGAQYSDCTTDVTRTVAVGPPTPEQRDRFTRVLKGHIALARVRFPEGTTGSQLDALARLFLWDAGLDYDHGTGHGVGSYLGVHEGPQQISKRAGSAPLQAGMIISNEPGYYKSGEYGIRIENLVLVRDTGVPEGGEHPILYFETLTKAPIDLALVDAGLLTPDEADWLNAYHDDVRQSLTPLLDDKTARWLAEATRPVMSTR